MAYHMSELSRSLKPFSHTPHGQEHTTSISYVSDVIPDYTHFDQSVRIDELIVHEPDFLKNSKYS